MSGSRSIALAAAVVLLLASCTADGPPPSAPVALSPGSIPGPPVRYVSIGASETDGVGTDDPFRDAWPRVFWRSLPPGSTLFNFGVAGSTAAQARREQVAEAVEVEPDVATVWLNVNDLVRGVPPTRFGRSLRAIVHELRGAGETTVLVANTPRVDLLPLYLACRAPNGTYRAPLGNVVVCPPDLESDFPPPSTVQRAVRAYNLQISRVAGKEGAIMVNIRALGRVQVEHPEFIAADGFHPSTEGAVVVAETFAKALTDSASR